MIEQKVVVPKNRSRRERKSGKQGKTSIGLKKLYDMEA